MNCQATITGTSAKARRAARVGVRCKHVGYLRLMGKWYCASHHAKIKRELEEAARRAKFEALDAAE
jgi:hypothetical protein